MPGISPLAASFIALIQNLIQSARYSEFNANVFRIAMICRAICALPKSLNAIPPIVPLHVRSKSPASVITCGEVVHLANSTLPSTKLLAPVIQGMPTPSALYSEGERSRPEISSHNSFSRTKNHPSGSSKGISSLMFSTLLPIFS